MSRTMDTLAVTTGTSLLTNLRRVPHAGGEFEAWLATQPEGDRDLLRRQRPVVERAARAALAGRWDEAGRELAGLQDTPRVLGAEIASLAVLLEEAAFRNLAAVHLIHSDTDEGRGCAEAVRVYLTVRRGLMPQLQAVGDLQHGLPSRFRVAGLRNLVSVLARIHRHCGGRLALDATGGYKAQIALAVLFGQAFQVPVFYRFEEFGAPMEFPPLPVRFDHGIVEEFLPLFQQDVVTGSFLEGLVGSPLREDNPRFSRVRTLLEGPEGGSREATLWAVSPFGMLLYEQWLAQAGDAGSALLPEAARPADPGPRWGSHHRPGGVEAFIQRLLATFPWIERIQSRPARGRSHAADGATFRLAAAGGEVPPIECVYARDNHPAVLHITTTARTRAAQLAALRELIRDSRSRG